MTLKTTSCSDEIGQCSCLGYAINSLAVAMISWKLTRDEDYCDDASDDDLYASCDDTILIARQLMASLRA